MTEQICYTCSKKAEVKAVERLPNTGILIHAIHEDGTIHKWTEYGSLENVGKAPKNMNPQEMKCPRCGKLGKVIAFRDKKGVTRYYIKHGKIGGIWGKGKFKIEKVERHYMTPEEKDDVLRKLGRYIEPQSQSRDIRTNISISSNDSSKNIRSTEVETVKGEENPKKGNSGQIKHMGLTFVPRHKRLTTCTVCKKPGYKYKTYFQHYNEPPVGKVRLRGKEIGDKYRRCYFPKQKEKHEQDNTKRIADLKLKQTDATTTYRDKVSQKLDGYIERSSSGQSKEDNDRKDYKKMYFDLVDSIRKLIGVF
jgi:hypothetical protein